MLATDLLAAWEEGGGQDALDRAVTMLAALGGVPADEAARIDVARRDAVLTSALRALSGRSLLVGELTCDGCGDPLDIPVDLAALPDPPPAVDGVPFALPTSEDLRLVRGMSPEEARSFLLARYARVPGAGDERWAEAMEVAAPASAVTIAATCPECGTVTRADLDVSVLLWAEFERHAVELLAQVHLLASAYGWTEDEVLALGPRRRATYLRMAAG
ncbi:hypothetical protein [Actinophytocola oryzae]|uniref:Uncharacterized protein n=1 Tax=Actinophytocola oryzae TaxID=502181 RepID=A0A4R7VHY4_9PSEU|nr:hypothetical protein [Actinophytocola oryzae]TDV48777.1 hypothetical protein CLV71_108137 [Actinophytocola oryzae]